MFRYKSISLAAALATSLLTAGTAHGAAIIKDLTVVNQIPGLTGFATTGAMMTGLRVTANFANGSQSLLWATTGAMSGGVSNAFWSLSLTGDSFSNAWVFNQAGASSLGVLRSLELDGTNALTVLDTTLPSPGTPDSASGLDFDITGNPGLNALAVGTYSRVVAVSPNGPVGDLFQTLRITFGPNGTRESFTFLQDTDNDARFQTPEPGSLALVGLALAAAGALRRRA